MATDAEAEKSLRAKFSQLLAELDERQQRLCLGSKAQSLGRGGIAAAARAAGVIGQTVAAGMRKLKAGSQPPGRARRPGADRKPAVS
jgi:hypothetical protein